MPRKLNELLELDLDTIQDQAELRGILTDALAEAGRFSTMATHAEEQVQRFSNEVGELRKHNENTKSLLETIRSLQEKLDTLSPGTTKATSTDSGDESHSGDAPTQEEVIRLEQSLSAEAKSAVEAVWETLTPEQRERFHSDPSFRWSILEEAARRNRKTPDSPWSSPTSGKEEKGSSSGEPNIVELFENTLRGPTKPRGPASRTELKGSISTEQTNAGYPDGGVDSMFGTRSADQ